MDGIKKTALFLCGLETKTVDLLLSRLDPETARNVLREMRCAGYVSVQDTDRLAGEFLRGISVYRKRTKKHDLRAETFSIPERSSSGTDAPPERRGMASRSSDSGASRFSTPPTSSRSDSSFGFLRHCDARLIARELSDEHPQITAAVLSRLSAKQRRDVLAEMPQALRADVAQRLADLEDGRETPDSSLLRDIEATLQKRFQRSANRERRFEDLERLGDAELSTLFHGVDSLTAMLSLVGARPSLIERVTRSFSPTEEERMRHRLCRLGSIDEEDVLRAREAVLDKAELLLVRKEK